MIRKIRINLNKANNEKCKIKTSFQYDYTGSNKKKRDLSEQTSSFEIVIPE